MLKKRKKLLISILSIILLFSMIWTAYANPLSELYTQDAPDGVGVGPMVGVGIRLNQGGYDSHLYNNTTAYYVRRTMHQDAIFHCYSHGLAFYPGNAGDLGGGMQCENNTWLTAESSSYNNAYSLEAKFANTSYKLKDCRFAFFDGCDTGATSSRFGNIVSYAHNTLYADVALGFDETIYVAPNQVFCDTFYEESLINGKTISLSTALAIDEVTNSWSGGMGMCSWVFSGNTNIYLIPASYGTYR